MTKSHRIVFVQGWAFRYNNRFRHHADAIRDYFRPLAVHEKAVHRVVTNGRQKGDVLIGVHLRQGDYATFQAGQYFFTTPQYYQCMCRAARLFAPKKVVFLVCSDTPQSEHAFGDLAVVFGPNHLIEDLYALAECDYLMGPPSTYSLWASFYGKTPLCSLETADADLRQEDFQLHFDN